MSQVRLFARSLRRSLRFALAALLLAAFLLPLSYSADEWQALAPGLEFRSIAARAASSHPGAPIAVLRIDPKRWEFAFVGVAEAGDSTLHTAREWCARYHLTAAINAGMYAVDQKTHIGYLRSAGRVDNPKRNSYQSLAVFAPAKPALPEFRIADLDAPGVSFDSLVGDYASAVQNLRLIKRPGLNQWSPQEKQWSEAALAEDNAGRALFVFSRTPFSMYEFNQELLAAGLGIVAAQHLEGGPEAQLYVESGGFQREWVGTFEGALSTADSAGVAWPIPNVLGLRPRRAATR